MTWILPALLAPKMSAGSLISLCSARPESGFTSLQSYFLNSIRKRLIWPKQIFCIEVELGIQRALDVLGLAKAMLLAFERKIGHRQAFCPQRIDHQLGLTRRHDLVL